ncbi:MAG TPA: hypothetical protein PLZ51_20195, partial [Aggregatilineales bacterium]|nr:hypothetical protein [Aggregatilineales bacterium]
YLKIDVLGQYNYSFSGNDLFLAIVGIRGAQADIFYIGDSGTVDLSSYDDAYAMILSLTRRSDDESCRFEDWQISVTEGTGSLVSPDTEVWDATFFEPPVQSVGTERYIGVMDDTSDVAEYRLFLQAGDVLNVYAGATNG